jgi:hypothetical protein
MWREWDAGRQGRGQEESLHVPVAPGHIPQLTLVSGITSGTKRSVFPYSWCTQVTSSLQTRR